MEHTVTLEMRPLGFVQRLWYWWLGIPAPRATSERRGRWMRLLPQSWTRFHRNYAHKHGLFWSPCVLCDRPYGGHQHAGSIPDPTYPEHSGRSISICPRCTRKGRSWNVPHPLEAVLDEIRDEHGHGHEPMIRDCMRCVAHDAVIRDALAE